MTTSTNSAHILPNLQTMSQMSHIHSSVCDLAAVPAQMTALLSTITDLKTKY